MIIENVGNMITSVIPEENILKILCHGCNAQGRMGSGIALEIKNTYNGAYQKYVNKHTDTGLQLGENVVYCHESEMFQVWNMITQEFYRGFKHSNGLIEPHDKIFVDYNALANCFKELNEECKMWLGMNYEYKLPGFFYKEKTVKIEEIQVHFPKIGAGLASGDWDLIKEIIDLSIDNDFSKNLWVLP